MRFASGNWQAPVLDILRDPSWDKELRLSAIRYFDRYPYAPAETLLLALAADEDAAAWEYRAVACTALAHYPSSAARAVLAQAIRSENWFVRYNAAASLEALGLSGEELVRLAGGDAYAQDMLRYRLAQREKEGAV